MTVEREESALLRIVPVSAASVEQQRKLDDLRAQVRTFAATILAMVPPGDSRNDAVTHFTRTVTALVVGIMRQR